MLSRIMSSGKIQVALYVALLCNLFSCKLPAPLLNTTKVNIPKTYSGPTDTTQQLASKDVFFKDSLLKKLIDDAMQNNFDLLAAQQRIEAAKSNVLLSRSALAPNVGINTFGSNTKYGRYTMDGAGNATTPEVPSPIVPSYMLGINSSWEVDLWGKLKQKRRAAQLRYYSTEMGKNLLMTQVLSEIAYRYYDLVAWDEELKIIKNNVKLQTDALATVKAQKAAGRANELVEKQFSAQLLRTKALEFGALQEIKRLENELLMLTGKEGYEVNRDTSIFSISANRLQSAGVPSQLLYRRPDLMQAELELKAAAADVSSARAAFLPSLSISANAGFNTYHPELFFNPASAAFGVLGTLTGPLLNRRAVAAGYQQSTAANKEAWFKYGKAMQGAVYEVRTILNDLNNLDEQYKLNELETRELKTAVSISRDLYAAGYANYLEIITAQQNVLDAELKLVNTKRKLLVSNVNLYRSLGGGWQ